MKFLSNIFKFEITDFLTIYYDFVYFLCLCPFRLVRTQLTKKCSLNNSFSVKTCWLQKLCCIIVALLGFPWLLRDIRVSISQNNKRNDFSKKPTVYFDIMLSIVGSLLRLSVVQVFWKTREDLCKIVNFLAQQNSLKVNMNGNYAQVYRKLQSRKSLFRFGIMSVCLIYTVIGLFNWFMGRSLSVFCFEGSSIYKWDLSWWFNVVIGATKYSFFLESKNNSISSLTDKSCTGNGEIQSISLFDSILAILGYIGFYYRRVLGSQCNCFQLMAIFTLWTCVKKFLKDLRPLDDQSSGLVFNSTNNLQLINLNYTVIQRYLALKQLSKLLNSVYGTNITLFLVEAILYYAVSLDQMFEHHGSNRDFTKVVLLFFYFGSTCLVLLVAADITKQMNYFKCWLSLPQNHDNIPTSYLYVLINDIDTDAVSIKASNIFPLTYVLAAKVLGVTVTYFIICVQD